jgi:hypothetical protein
MYTNVNGMRSARFPLQGMGDTGMFRADIFGKQLGPLGCNCTPMSGFGQTPAPSTSTVGAMLPILALGALVIGVGVMASGSGRKHVTANRRRRR